MKEPFFGCVRRSRTHPKNELPFIFRIDPYRLLKGIAMAQTFSCTGCGAALEYTDGAEHTVRCPYCGNNMPVPEEFWREVETKKAMSKWGKYLIIFLVITVGVPTCLGLVGTLLGIGGSIFGIIVSFLVSIFAH
jgi:LSD1 subclass zinc finger protein